MSNPVIITKSKDMADEVMRIFITGTEGLIGKATRLALERHGHTVYGCDLRSPCVAEKFDFRNTRKLRVVLEQCDGVLHLGALSRVVWGETHPHLCRSINVDGMNTLTKTISEMSRKIWLIFASSREIYGTPPKLPCTSDTPPCPENLYARSKIAGENMTWDMRRRGYCVAVLRFSNVFGTVNDYHDRVVPAFAKAAAHGGVLHVRGADSMLDFTPLEDTVDAIVRAVRIINDGVCDLPAIDIVTGRATSLADIAQMALIHGHGNILTEPCRSFYPARFQGDAGPAKKYLGWVPQKSLEDAVEQLVSQFKEMPHAYTENHSWLPTAL